jgi:hypothetical protein
MSFASKLRNIELGVVAPIGFYGVAGIILLIVLPFANFPPHIGLTGVLSIVAAYGLFKKRSWALWLVAALFAVATAITLITLYYVAFSNLVVGLSMIAYAVLTWIFTLYLAVKNRPAEA